MNESEAADLFEYIQSLIFDRTSYNRRDLLSDTAARIVRDEMSHIPAGRAVIRFLETLRDELALGADAPARAPMRIFRDMGFEMEEIQLEIDGPESGGEGDVFDLVRSPALNRLLIQLDAYIDLLREEVR
ncbi:hypothetical protein IU429_02790 [Nocardia elegans]|uniref:Uncharacterized protein n=1 Tax=Nocardia elegans TaxID=300029 RepID=A0ABW6THK3_9NOCA|nr:hypothetical protein [Nocardia elegans]MBF6446588.1 hypothetical protein [Nocardia elegans]